MQRWMLKFYLATRGVLLGVRGQDSFLVHIPVAMAVVALAAITGCEPWRWCVLLLCIGFVLSAELANSALENLAAGLCHEHNEDVGRALDIASGAVLVASATAATVGCLVLITRFISW